MGPSDNDWHLDKKVPISIIIALFIQSIVFVYVGTTWKADVDARIGSLEKSEDRASSYESRIITLEQGVLGIREDLAEIKTMLRAQNTPPRAP